MYMISKVEFLAREKDGFAHQSVQVNHKSSVSQGNLGLSSASAITGNYKAHGLGIFRDEGGIHLNATNPSTTGSIYKSGP